MINPYTPVKWRSLRSLLIETNYDEDETEFLVNGFKFGFELEYSGPADRCDTSRNIPFTVGNKFILWEKIMKEVRLKRYAGPYEEVPFDNFIQSPVGLVPKAGDDTRLIFHLSYKFPNGNESVNFWTPKDLCSVKYRDIEHAVANSLNLIKNRSNNVDQGSMPVEGIFSAKNDLLSAFRVLPLKASCYKWLVLMAYHPLTNKKFYFIDKNLPFGSRISCSHFQRVSDGLAWLTEKLAQKECVITNYLDDFLFVETSEAACNHLVRTFLRVCEDIQFPVSMNKTVWASRNLVFLGMLLLGRSLQISVPVDKKLKAQRMLLTLCEKKKATVNELERLAGFLNFLNRAIVPGRIFTRRMYAKYSYAIPWDKNTGQPKPILRKYHHVNLDAEFRNDCKVWLLFLENTEAVCRPFVDLAVIHTADQLFFYSDASKNERLGFGCIFDREWIFGCWEEGFIKNCNPTIGYLELFALCAGIFTWADKLKNGRFQVWCDNQWTQTMVNNGTSSCHNCCYLLRMLTLNNLCFNRRIRVEYVDTKTNLLSDALSRLQFDRFFRNAPENVKRFPEQLPAEIWPVSRIWQK